MAFSLKAEQKEMVFVSGISKISKTNEIDKLLRTLKKEVETKKFTFVLSEKAKDLPRVIKNLKNTSYVFYRDANALDIYKGGMIVVDEEIFTNIKGDDKSVRTNTTKAVKKEVKK